MMLTRTSFDTTEPDVRDNHEEIPRPLPERNSARPRTQAAWPQPSPLPVPATERRTRCDLSAPRPCPSSSVAISSIAAGKAGKGRVVLGHETELDHVSSRLASSDRTRGCRRSPKLRRSRERRQERQICYVVGCEGTTHPPHYCAQAKERWLHTSTNSSTMRASSS